MKEKYNKLQLHLKCTGISSSSQKGTLAAQWVKLWLAKLAFQVQIQLQGGIFSTWVKL